jgi:hypothetical protein
VDEGGLQQQACGTLSATAGHDIHADDQRLVPGLWLCIEFQRDCPFQTRAIKDSEGNAQPGRVGNSLDPPTIWL